MSMLRHTSHRDGGPWMSQALSFVLGLTGYSARVNSDSRWLDLLPKVQYLNFIYERDARLLLLYGNKVDWIRALSAYMLENFNISLTTDP